MRLDLGARFVIEEPPGFDCVLWGAWRGGPSVTDAGGRIEMLLIYALGATHLCFPRKFEGVNQMDESRKRHNVAKTVNHSVVWGKRRVDVNACFSGTGASW